MIAHEMNMDTSTTPMEDEPYLDDDLAFSRDREKGIELQAYGEGNTSSPKGGGSASEEEDDDDGRPLAAPGRRRMRAGFVVDSDSD
jgi:replication fork protection complex subunit Tof1/Swi1